MIKFYPPPEPLDFDAKVRQPGRAWLQKHPMPKKPLNLWGEFRDILADYSHNLCNYSAMLDLNGTIDHYLSQKNHPHLIYEWSNYRYASGWINTSKRTKDNAILDPFEIGDDWFEILLPSLQLVMTDAIPFTQRERAKNTLNELHLIDSVKILRLRQHWYEVYKRTKDFSTLADHAPLIARAVQKQILSTANAFIQGESLGDFPPHLQNKEQIHEELQRLLPHDNEYWLQWVAMTQAYK